MLISNPQFSDKNQNQNWHLIITSSKLQLRLAQSLIFLFLLAPFHLQIIKLLLAILLITNAIISKNFYISKKCIIWGLTFELFNSLYIVYSIIKNNPGVDYYLPTYIIWPILFTFASGAIPYSILSSLLKTIKTCITIIIISGVFAFLYFNITIQPEGEFYLFEASIRPGFPFIAITSPLISGFIFWFFFIFSLLFLKQSKLKFKDGLFIILSIVFIFATSRRILYINFGISLILILLCTKYLPKKIRLIVKYRTMISMLVMGAFIIGAILLLINLDFMEASAMTDFFDKTSEASDTPRISQVQALTEGWLENPILGAGTGIDASISRSDIPGNYELSYLAKLFETGIIGMSIYMSFWIILFIWTYQIFQSKVIEAKYSISLFTAMVIFMISNATNPYLNAFDYIWYMYVPLIFINITTRNKDKNSLQNVF